MATKTFIVKTPVNHDNTVFVPGETIDLEAKAAEPLLAVGAIEPAQVDAKAKKPQ